MNQAHVEILHATLDDDARDDPLSFSEERRVI